MRVRICYTGTDATFDVPDDACVHLDGVRVDDIAVVSVEQLRDECEHLRGVARDANTAREIAERDKTEMASQRNKARDALAAIAQAMGLPGGAEDTRILGRARDLSMRPAESWTRVLNANQRAADAQLRADEANEVRREEIRLRQVAEQLRQDAEARELKLEQEAQSWRARACDLEAERNVFRAALEGFLR